MTHTLLTPEDRDWLKTQADAVTRSMDFLLSSMFRPKAYQTAVQANAMLVWYEGAYHQVEPLLRSIEAKINSGIFEQWEVWRWEAVMRVSRKMNALEAKALILAAGFADADVDAMYASADEAVSEAREAMYGSEEDY